MVGLKNRPSEFAADVDDEAFLTLVTNEGSFRPVVRSQQGSS